jgi:hypothetical protein
MPAANVAIICAARARFGDDDEPLRHARHFSTACLAQSSAHRSLIAFTAWSSFAHAAVMSYQAFRNLVARGELIGSAVLVVIGVALIVLAPAKSVDRVSAAVA